MTDGWLKATRLRSISESMIRASGRYSAPPALVRSITALQLSRYDQVRPPVQHLTHLERHSVTNSLPSTQGASGVMEWFRPQSVGSSVTFSAIPLSTSHISNRWWLVIGAVPQNHIAADLHCSGQARCLMCTLMKTTSALSFHCRQQ